MEPVTGKRGAYIELNLCHGEVQPTFWWLAGQAGVELDFYVMRPMLDDDSFAHVPDAVERIPIEAADPHHPCAGPLGGEERWNPDRYDFLILGTGEPADRVARISRIPLPTLVVVHNTDRVLPPPPGITWCALTPAAATRLGAAGPTVLVEPYYLGEPPADEHAPAGGPAVFSVPGQVHQAHRNYRSLAAALVALRGDGLTPDDIRVRIVGRWRPTQTIAARPTPLHGDILRSNLAYAGVAEYVDFPEDELPYREYCRRVRTSRAVLPLVDDFAPATRRYLAGKCSSATTQAVAWQRPLVVNGRYADSLGLETGYRYRIDDLASGMRAALESPTDVEQQASLAQFRDARLAASARAFTEWVHP